MVIYLYSIGMTKDHFKTDEVTGSYKIGGSSKPSGADRNRNDDRVRQPKPKRGDGGEDDEIRKAIELSKITAQKEEAARLKEVAKAQGKIKDKSGRVGSNQNKSKNKEDIDFGQGFEKFATMNAGGRIGGDNLDDFDFGDSKPSDKDGGEFNFNFGAEEKKEEKPKKKVIEPSA